MFGELRNALSCLWSWRWPEATGEVTSVILDTVPDLDGEYLRLAVAFKFFVGEDGPYTGHSFWTPVSRDRALAARERFHVHDEIAVRYRPNDPSENKIAPSVWPPEGRRSRLLRDVGLCLFLVSFFLPALGDMGGFQAAFFGIVFVRPWQPDDKLVPLAAFGAWLNPEVLLLFSLSVFQRCPRVRALLVVTILFSIPMTWIALRRMDHGGVAVYPLGPGHFLWIAGILLIVFAESPAFRFSPARWLTGGLGIVTAAMSVPILIGFTMRAPREADDFHYDQAWDTQNAAECLLIDAHAVGRPDQRDSSDFTYMQSDCYRNVAAMRHDPQLCDHVKSGSLDRLIGSVVAKSKCRKQKYTIGSAFPGTRSSPDPFGR